MKHIFYFDQDFITAKSWIKKRLPKKFNINLPFFGAIEWEIDTEHSIFETLKTKGAIMALANMDKLAKLYNKNHIEEVLQNTSPNEIVEKIKNLDKSQWIQEIQLDTKYYVYIFRKNPNDFISNNINVDNLTLLIKPKISAGLPNVALTQVMANINIEGIHYFKSDGSIEDSFMGQCFRVKSIYQE